MSGAYASSLQHVLAELERLDLLLALQVQRVRRADGDGDGDDRHLDAEVDRLLAAPLRAPPWADVVLPPEVAGPAQERLDAMAAEIEGRTRAAIEDGVVLRLVVLAHLFGLATFDVDALLVCLAPELDRRYERLYAFLHDDLHRPQASVDLVLHLLCPDVATRVAARTRFSPSAPLVRHRLVELVDEPGGRSPTLPSRLLQLDPRIARFLLGDDDPDERLAPYARLAPPRGDRDADVGVDDLVLPAATARRVAEVVHHARTGGHDLVLYLQGPYGVGKRSVAEVCAAAIGAPLLVVAGRRWAERGLDELEARAALIDREARLQGALLYVEDFDALLAPDRRARLATLLARLEAHPGPTFLAGDTTWEPSDALHGATFVRLELPRPGYDERLALWRSALGPGAEAPAGGGVDVPALAGKFRLTGGQIVDAVATARGRAHARHAADTDTDTDATDADADADADAPATVTQADLEAACRLQSNRALDDLAQQVVPRHTWDDLVLPADQREQLREVFHHLRYRAVVHDAWGFGAKLATGHGLNVLFAGPPGTGKTMAAEVLAHGLGLDLYRIDLSQVLSKYIGETEKNLARIFDEARTSNAILFFDEADALFGKRTQVRDAHDRYANVEVSYLLQRIDDYEGLVVLASNLRKNMDEAFVRRLHFTIDFPMPGPDDRRRIWAGMWPADTPLDPGVDLDRLARDVPVSGGAIRNIAVAGAFLAAADGGVVTMDHLLHATRREYQKMGKVLTTDPNGNPKNPNGRSG